MIDQPNPPSFGRISDYLRHNAELNPTKKALIATDRQLTYGEFAKSVDDHARALLAAGVKPGDRVALMARPSVQFVVSYLATASIGAIWQGLNPSYTPFELEYVLSDAQPRLVFAAASVEEHDALDIAARKTGLDGITPLRCADEMDLFNKAGEAISANRLWAAQAAVDTNDPALIVYTSGSTGAPKGALIRHAGLVRLGLVENAIWDLLEPVMLSNLPINHIGGVGDLVSVPIVAGATLVLRESFDAREVLRDIEAHRISALFQIPTQLQRICALPEFAAKDLPSLQLVGWGGSPLPKESLARFRTKGCRLIATYGLTEATSSVSYTDHDAPDEVLLNTVGRPDPGMEVRLLDEAGQWVAEGNGEICVRNETVMAGYLNRAEATAAAFTDEGWLRTGDIGYIRADGNLVLVGRRNDMFKSGGYNIYPREIESVLESHPDIQLSAVVARPDAEFYEVGVAYVQLASDSMLETTELRQWCRERLANFKVPKEIIIVGSLPLLAVGKVDKVALRDHAHKHTTRSNHV